MVGNLALSYDITPKITMNVTVANLFHTCFGGSKEPWTSAYPASSNVCGYTANRVLRVELPTRTGLPDAGTTLHVQCGCQWHVSSTRGSTNRTHRAMAPTRA